MPADSIFHIATQADWKQAKRAGEYRCESLELEGFIHCSTKTQLLIPANERFAFRRDLLLLRIDVTRLSEELRYEDCYSSGMDFPHVYGGIALDAVVEVLPFQPGADGLFQLPVSLSS